MGQRDDEMGIYEIVSKSGKVRKVNPARGKRIADLLEQRGMSQSDLARRMGVARATISRYVSGIATPRGRYLAGMVEELQTTPAYLIGYRPKDDDSGVIDAEKEYRRAMYAITRCAGLWTKEEKLALIGAIFDDKA